MSDGGQLTARLRPALGTARRHPVPLIKCPYCRQTFGPWGAAAIEPCRLCERPLHRSLGWARPRQVVVLLDTINACQGMAVMVAGIAFVTGGVILQRLCAWIALALFVSATAYITDGAMSKRVHPGFAAQRFIPQSAAVI